MRCCSFWVSVCVMLLAAPALAVPRCGWAELERFVERAQRADTMAIRDGQTLMACPPGTRIAERAVQWLAFLYQMTGNAAKSLRTDLPGSPLKGGTQAAVLSRARGGAYQELRQLVDGMAPGYATNPEAQLVLARVATRKSAFVRGREAYRIYLGLNPRDEDAICEELYTWIWQGDFVEAESQFRDALRYGGSVRLRGCLQRGLTLAIARHEPRHAEGAQNLASGTRSAMAGAWRGDMLVHRVPRIWQRQTLSVGHEGIIGMRLAGHELRLEALGKGVSRATEARLSGRYDYEQALAVDTEIGFWSPGRKNTFGHGEIALKLPWHLYLGTGVSREPLALSLPLVPDARGVMQDTIYFAGGFDTYAELRLSVLREESFSPHELHRLLLKWPIEVRGPNDFVRMRLPLTVERHPRPSPFYVADVRTDSIGLGLEGRRTWRSRFEFAMTADYSLATATQRDPEATQSRYGIFDAEVKLTARLPRECRLHLDGSYHRVDEEDIGVRRLLANTLGLGMACAH